MVEVTIDSIRVSLMSQHRLVILKDVDSDRYLTIWIGPCEADAITVTLQEVEVVRPLTHDLMKNIINEMGGTVEHILINDLRNEVYYAKVVVKANGQKIEVDARPSDALALAVRVHVPVYVQDDVMARAAVTPEPDVDAEPATPAGGDDKLDPFLDFVDSLDFDDIDPNDKDK